MVIWGIVGHCFGTNNIPQNIQQYKRWIKKLPRGDPLYNLGFAAICWALWKCGNRACFDRKIIKNPAKVIIHACALMSYLASLYNVISRRRF